MARPRLALVPGEPAGVGPELTVRVLQHAQDADVAVFGDADVLARAADALGLPLPAFALEAIPCPAPSAFGTPNPANAQAVIDALLAAGDACLNGRMHGVVTGPVHKAAINAGGIAYTGTTELLAEQAGCEVVMMLANAHMRVGLVTTHLPLRAVADAISAERLMRTIAITHAQLQRDFGIANPHLLVLGLNPHAGEDGVLGDEELRIINPALDELRSQGMRLTGPLPADTAFLPAKLRECDAVIAMYHDQGLPVLKYSGFEQAVNITLGLPYPRVAVDHGTALDLAGTGLADAASLQMALKVCAQMASANAARR